MSKLGVGPTRLNQFGGRGRAVGVGEEEGVILGEEAEEAEGTRGKEEAQVLVLGPH